jgi:hypothetical protein
MSRQQGIFRKKMSVGKNGVRPPCTTGRRGGCCPSCLIPFHRRRRTPRHQRRWQHFSKKSSVGKNKPGEKSAVGRKKKQRKKVQSVKNAGVNSPVSRKHPVEKSSQ